MNDKMIREIEDTAKTILAQAESGMNYNDGFDVVAQFKALRTIKVLAQTIIDKAEGYPTK